MKGVYRELVKKKQEELKGGYKNSGNINFPCF